MTVPKHHPQRTCVGCRTVFRKDEVVRIVAGPTGAVIDYREKLPGRAVYVCPTRACMTKALAGGAVAKLLRGVGKPPDAEAFIADLTQVVTEKIKSLLIMASKAGLIAVGYSAVQDALAKGRVEVLIVCRDLSTGTNEKLAIPDPAAMRRMVLFVREELGALMNRELVGVAGIVEKGLADAVWREYERLKGLINAGE